MIGDSVLAMEGGNCEVVDQLAGEVVLVVPVALDARKKRQVGIE